MNSIQLAVPKLSPHFGLSQNPMRPNQQIAPHSRRLPPRDCAEFLCMARKKQVRFPTRISARRSPHSTNMPTMAVTL